MNSSDHRGSRACNLRVNAVRAWRLLWLALCAEAGVLVALFYAGLIAPGWSIEGIAHALPIAAVGGLLVPVVVMLSPRFRAWFRPEGASIRRWATLASISLIVLFYAIEYWRGRSQWASLIRELQLQEGSLDPGSVAEPPPPEELNFFAHPALETLDDRVHLHRRIASVNQLLDQWMQGEAPSLDQAAQKLWDDTTDLPEPGNRSVEGRLLELVRLHNEAIDAVGAAVAERPSGRLAIDGYYDWPPSIVRLRVAIDVAPVRALARIRTGQVDAAFADILLALRLTDLWLQQPVQFGYGIASENLVRALQPFWEGFFGRQWTAEQLRMVEEQLGSMSWLERMDRKRRFDFLLMIDLVNQIDPVGRRPSRRIPHLENTQAKLTLFALRLIYPSGWSYQNQEGLYRTMEEASDCIDLAAATVHPDCIPLPLACPSLDPLFATFMMPRVRHWVDEFPIAVAWSETARRLAIGASVLERYRLETGAYPDDLEALPGPWRDLIPRDVIDDRPLRYRLQGDGGFVLYSIGWNRRDDQGAPSEWTLREGGRRSSGDWTWIMPPRPSERY